MSDIDIPFELKPGRRAIILDRSHVLDRIDADRQFVFRKLGSSTTFQIPDASGFPTHPNAADVLRLMADGTIELEDEELEQPQAAARRNAEHHVADARALDPVSDLRVAFLRRYDQDKRNLSDAALTGFYDELLRDPSFQLLAIAHPKAKRKGRRMLPWRPCGAALRNWLNTRGCEDDRRQGDGVSGTGRFLRVKTVRHPPEILLAWASRAHSNKRNIFENWQSYSAEIRLVNEGKPTLRLDEDGEPVCFARPASPYKAKSYSSFYRLHKRLRSEAAKKARDGALAAAAAYGGGGTTEIPPHVGAICGMDDSPAPVLCKLDVGGDVFVGRPTFTQLIDYRCNGRMGWDLSWDQPSSATALRTIAHASTPKRVPAHVERADQLSAMVVKPDLLIVDNLTAHHAKHLEDTLREHGTDVRFTGAKRPRDKAETEAAMGTALAFAFKGLPAAVEEVTIRRHNENDPPVELLPTIAELREMLDEAMPLLNLAPQKPLKQRSALSVFLRELERRRVNVIKDVAAFRRSIGLVSYDVELRASGIEHFTCLRFVQPSDAPSLFERLRHLERPTKRTRVSSVTVKVKFDASDIGRIQVWDPTSLAYVTFACDEPDYADGLPKWVHEWILSSIAEDERAFCSPSQLIEYRARLFARQSGITQAAGEDERRRAASLADTPIFRRIVGEYVQVGDEGYFAEPVSVVDDDRFADVETAGPHLGDVLAPTPRSRSGGGKPRRGPTKTAGSRTPPAPTPAPRHAPRADGRAPRPRSPSNRRTPVEKRS